MSEQIYCVLEKTAVMPHRGSVGAACWDIHSFEDCELKPYKAAKIRTGISCELPEGHALLILPRSGFSFKNQIILPNSLGVIDEDYRGEISVTAMWMPDILEMLNSYGQHTTETTFSDGTIGNSGISFTERSSNKFDIKKGDRIAQAMLIKYVEQNWRAVNELSNTSRGAGGFGSTGIRPKHPES